MNKHLSLKDILCKDSLFYDSWLHESHDKSKTLEKSIHDIGLLQPIIVYENTDNTYHLLDGFKRIEVLKRLSYIDVLVTCLPPETPKETLVDYIFNHHLESILSSAAKRFFFVAYAKNANVSSQEIQKRYMTSLSLDPSLAMINHAISFMSLPTQVKQDCHDKHRSVKQCLFLSQIPENQLMSIYALKQEINLSATLFCEIVEICNDLCRRHNTTVNDLLTAPNIQSCLSQNWPRPRKTRAFIDALKKMHRPITTTLKEKLSQKKETLNCPKHIDITWDPSLEKKEITLTAHCATESAVIDLKTWMLSNETVEGIGEILNQL